MTSQISLFVVGFFFTQNFCMDHSSDILLARVCMTSNFGIMLSYKAFA